MTARTGRGVGLVGLMFAATAQLLVRGADRPSIRPALPGTHHPLEFNDPAKRIQRGDDRDRDRGRVRMRIFFPPDPPPLGARVARYDNPWPERDVAEELALHVMEPYYPPLGTCLVDLRESVRRHYRPRLANHVESRDYALAELREVLARTERMASADRERHLLSLARQQAGFLRSLERDAEELREELADRASWSSLREWKLGVGALRDPGPERRAMELLVVRAAAYYQSGLSPAQRRLLREATIDLQQDVFASSRVPPAIFFSPDLARFMIPGDWPPALRVQVEEYVRAKDALRKELVAAVVGEDRAMFSHQRRRAFAALAEQQASRFDELETMAETVRRDLASWPGHVRRERPAEIPAEIQAQIDAYLQEKQRLQEAFVRRLEAMRAAGDFGAPAADEAALDAEDRYRREVREAALGFDREHAAELAELNAMLDEIFPRLAAFAGSMISRDKGAAIPDQFLTDFLLRHREAWAYFEYEAAMFEPGLSPEQRRLLFCAAIRRLKLPLPPAELQPTEAPQTIISQ